MKRLPNKIKARKLYRIALNKGKLIKKPCKVCGTDNVEGHHIDYSKPLEVMWLCRKHHRQWHSEHGFAKGNTDFRSVLINSKLHHQLKGLAMELDITLNQLLEISLKTLLK